MDVAVVGGGPAGLRAAEVSARRGATTIVFEENRQIGLPRHCTGLLSIKGVELIGEPARKSILNLLRALEVTLIDGSRLSVRFSEPKTAVLNRVKYERLLAQRCLDAGAEIRLGHKVEQIVQRRDRVVLKVAYRGGHYRVEARWAIVAEGFKGMLLQPYGYKPPKGRLPAIQATVRDRDWPRDTAGIILSRRYANGFFAWVVPTSYSELLVGFATSSGRPADLLPRLLRTLGFKGDTGRRFYGYVITGGPIGKLVYGRTAVVGDAAGHVKPTTGGGLLYGHLCSTLAGLYVPLGKANLYERTCKRIVHGRLKAMLWVRRLLNLLSDSVLNRVVRAASHPKVVEDIVSGDQDTQVEIVLNVIKNPFFYAGLTGLV